MKLAEFKLFHIKIRLFFRLNIFCYKILNHQILPNFFDKLEFIPQSLTRSKKANELVKVPFEGTKYGLARLSISEEAFDEVFALLNLIFYLYFYFFLIKTV